MKMKTLFTNRPGRLPRLIRSLLVSAFIALIALSGVAPVPAGADIPAFTATETVALQTDVNHDGIANPGDTLRYTINLSYNEVMTTPEAKDLNGITLTNTTDVTTVIFSSLRSTVITRDDYLTTPVGTTLTIPIANLLANDVDMDGNANTALYLCEYSSTTLNETPITRLGDNLFYTPPAGFTGVEAFHYGACDNTNFGDAAMVVINVLPAVQTFNSPFRQVSALADQAAGSLAGWFQAALRPHQASAEWGQLIWSIGTFNAGHSFWGTRYWLNLPGQSVRVSFDVTIDADIPVGTTNICDQGTAGNSAFNVLTDDPNLPGTADQTCIAVFVPDPTQDQDPPIVSITPAPATPDGANGWYKSAVTLNVQALDNASGVQAVRCALDPQTAPAIFDDLPVGSCAYVGGAQVTTDGTHALYAAAVDGVGNKSEVVSASFKIDATPPVITCQAAGPFLFNSGNQPVAAGVDAAVSGLNEAASSLSGVIATSPVGPKSVTFTAYDLAGNRADKACSYSVIYDFDGFYPPIGPGLNPATAVSVIPIKFSLGGNQGLNIFASGFPKVQRVDCQTLEPTGSAFSTSPAGKKGLSYNPLTGWYNYGWKTGKEKAGTCQVVIIQLIDGTQHLAYFKFR